MEKMTTALVIGSNGQDGSFLLRHLISKKYRVIGVGRQKEPRIKVESPLFTYYQADLCRTDILAYPLESFKPDLVFHVAAVHTSAGGSYESLFNDVLKVNVASVHAVMEYLRGHTGSRFIYASSAKVFGSPLPDVINEDTPKRNECLYSISKNTAYALIDYYRKLHGVSASVIYLFNHESEMRSADFFIPIVLRCLALSLRDASHVAPVNTLDFYCDWGSADEYMELMIDMVEKAPSEDFVLASGTCTYARDLVKGLFGEFGLDYKRHFKERVPADSTSARPYKVDLTKVMNHIRRIPSLGIHDVCRQILHKDYML